MASLKEVKNRINSVRSTQQITKAMKMVAASKLRRAQDRIIQLRPYSEKMATLLENVSASVPSGEVSSPFAVQKEANNILIVAVTSDRGLCGSFNANITKTVNVLLSEKYSAQMQAGKVSILSIGTKGMDYFKKRGYPLINDYADLFTRLGFDAVREAAESVMDGFLAGKYDVVELVYNEFKNVATQVIRVQPFLPIAEKTQNEGGSNTVQDYIFEPSKTEIIEKLIPKSLKISFYKAVLESFASEHGARMTAMDKATDNAGELLKELQLTYNRTRQAAITKEILEIVGGAEALANG